MSRSNMYDIKRNVIFKRSIRKEGALQKEDHKGYFHKWINQYAINEVGMTEMTGLALVEDEDGRMHKVQIEDLIFTGFSSSPDEDAAERRTRREADRESSLINMKDVIEFRSKMNGGNLPPSSFDGEEPPF